MPIRLVAMDLDDTLLRDDLTISARSLRAIQSARNRGVKIILATGRTPVSAEPYARQLELDTPAILYHGALIQEILRGEILYRKYIPSSLAGEIVQDAARWGIYAQLFLRNRTIAQSFTFWSGEYARIAGIPVETGDLREVLALEPEGTEKILCLGEENELDKFASWSAERYSPGLHFTKSKPCFLEIVEGTVNKGAALAVLAGKWGIPPEEVMAIGDSYNDLEMIRYAGIGVAMGNARGDVQAQADAVTLSNEEDGAAEALERYVLGDMPLLKDMPR